MSADRRVVVAVFAGGALGALIRAGLEELLPAGSAEWPWATFLANVVGTFLLGYFITRLQERLPLSAYRRPLLGSGLCGALTTFSTFQLELFRMLDEGRAMFAGVYAGGSVFAGLLGVAAASSMVRRAALR